MNKRFAKTAVMLALTALSTGVLAQDTLETEPPGRVGRVSLAQGKVSISGDVGESATEALVNWPVTTRNLITTEPNGRTEVRIGSTAVRIDGDSSLEVTELDDDSVRLRLHYGSASIRILSEDVLPEFELSTPQGRVRMLKPGRLRVDAERVRDTSVVSVFDGEAQVIGAGASLTIRAGRSAELRDDDVRTLQARRDAFDDWALARDREIDGSRSAQYVTTEMTGYEELDRHGTWQDDLEYGPLWIPAVTSSWVPYRDGRWTWIAPWGWTWVDNAPWGYAPFHYGRWVHVKNRWAWAPGHKHHHGRRPVWSPALVGWVGGSGWSASFNLHGARPATGWYPLGPRDHYVPHYRLSDERLRRLNSWSWRDRKDGDRRDRNHDGIPDYRQRGLTVVPHANFGQRGPIVVPNVPRATVPGALPTTPGAAPPPPLGWRDRAARRDSDRDGIRDRFDRDRDGDGIPNRVDSDPGGIRHRADLDGDGIRNRFDRDRDGDGIPNRVDRDGWGRDRSERGQRPPVLTTNPAPRPPVAATPGQLPFQPGAITTSPPPAPAVVQEPVRPQWGRGRDHDRAERAERWDRGDRGERFEGRRERPQPMMAMPQPAVPSMPAPQAVAPSPPPVRMAPPPPAPMAAPPAAQPAHRRFERRPEILDNNRPSESER
ncbi:DUF6600 domain-containing protein [Massilia sp. BSC265]|uniref:DUF6600 domain-containing protein n=1 Tax=Massilia sp. BSC265 TaxID=1549812 RepID=UPI00068C22BC|nr:DUF6600 domain-containing protein [Massilia sp. BSC265]